MSENLGFAIGIAVGLVVCVVYFLIRRPASCNEYDERQHMVRGKAYQYGFLTLLCYELIYGAAYTWTLPKWCDNTTGIFTGVMLSVLVFGVYCIWKDAYMNLNQNPGCIYLLFGAMGGVNLIIAFLNLRSGEMWTEGRLNYRSTNLMLGILFVIFFFTFWIKNHRERAGEE